MSETRVNTTVMGLDLSQLTVLNGIFYLRLVPVSGLQNLTLSMHGLWYAGAQCPICHLVRLINSKYFPVSVTGNVILADWLFGLVG